MTQQVDAAADSRRQGIYRVTLWGSAVNFLLVVCKFVAGVLGGSAAMVADAVHSLSDFVTDMVVLLFVRLSGKPCDVDHEFGHGKYETLATALIGLMLGGVGLGVLWSGGLEIVSWLQGETLRAPGLIALGAALLSLLSKELLYQWTVRQGRRLRSAAVVANAWHHRSDALSSLGTTAGIGGAIVLGEAWRVLDPLAAVVVSVLILKVAMQLFVPSMEELLEKSLPDEEEKEIRAVILEQPGCTDPHNLRTRRIGNYCAIDVHFRMDGRTTIDEAHRATREIEDRLRERFGSQTLINTHVEPVKPPVRREAE
ncbi:MAG: cation diffusion facilitator family transporter [Bacteroidales bacterium]|nr:cation diffusion facilitator family transporter [Bacteroidales bacterium]